MITRPPAAPGGYFGSDLPALAPAAAAFAPPAVSGFPIGGIVWTLGFALDAIEEGWLSLSGQEELIASYPELADRVGARFEPEFGAPSAGHFRLPSLRGRMIVHVDGLTFFTGDIGGAASHTLSVAEMPAHTHPPGGNEDFFWTNDTAAGTVIAGGATYNANNLARSTTGSAGGGAAHNNMPPYIALQAVVRALP